jgi:hypothetical protein
VVGHDQVDLDRDGVGAGLSGGPFDEGVGHHLPTSALVAGGAGGVGGCEQGGVGGDALGDWEQGAEPGHRVRGRA